MSKNSYENEGVKIMSVNDLKMVELAQNTEEWTQILNTSMREGKVKDIIVQLQLGIDKGNFSRILSGQANFPVEKLHLFCEIVGNDLPIHWIAYQRGYELRAIPKTLEEALKKSEEEKEEALRKVAYLESLLELKMRSSIGSNGA